MTSWIKSFRWAQNGLATVWKEERNFRLEVLAAIVFVVFAAYFEFSLAEWIVVAAVITIVIGAEVVNTVIEDLCNKIEPKQDTAIGKIKDMAAGFALVASLGAGLMGILLISYHFFY
jgi:diacylglycerol kinase